MDFLITSAINASGRAAGRAALPIGLSIVIALVAAMAYGALMAGTFVLLSSAYGAAIAWFSLAGFHICVAAILLTTLVILLRRRKQEARNAQLLALALAVAPRLLAKSPIASLITIGAAAYVIAKARER